MAETIVTKRCNKCKEIKHLLDFPKDKRNLDNRAGICKLCQKPYHKKYKQSDKYKISQKKYRQTSAYKHSIAKYRQSDKGKATIKQLNQTKKAKATRSNISRRYRLRHPEKGKAKDAVHHAIEEGHLKPATHYCCIYCDKQASQYHHYMGYDPIHWLRVVPLCRVCHRIIHNLPVSVP